MTRDALLSFQANNNLPLTGIADQQTLAVLPRGRPRALSVERMTADEKQLQEKGSKVINASTSRAVSSKGSTKRLVRSPGARRAISLAVPALSSKASSQPVE